MKLQGYGSAVVDFKFEAAHRQPQLGGKCANLHGHSWRAAVTLHNNTQVGGVSEASAVSVDLSEVKKIFDIFIDKNLDHACLLGVTDPLVEVLEQMGLKVYTFGDGGDYDGLPWPSIEAVAHMLGARFMELAEEFLGSYITIEGVMVSETSRNTYSWTSPAPDRLIPVEETPLTPQARQDGLRP